MNETEITTGAHHNGSLQAPAPHHLHREARVNLGAYYTEDAYVDIAWRLLRPHLTRQSTVLDSSCGNGNFFRANQSFRLIGNDIDSEAVKQAKHRTRARVYNRNALRDVSRSQYGIGRKAHLGIIGNPPYNDRTSQVRRNIKTSITHVDADLAKRDLGMSFLLSYRKLCADAICVLHPLSYLIKPSNFRAIKNFTDAYRLQAGVVISSRVFAQASTASDFPIVIALYLPSAEGMDHQQVLDFRFEVAGGEAFTLSEFDTIAGYVRKYPTPGIQPRRGDLQFWPLRDLNALKRNRTFLGSPSANAVVVETDMLEYYVYLDVIKQYAHHIPYYFGNCDVPIDDNLFNRYKRYFIADALSRHPNLHGRFAGSGLPQTAAAVSGKKIRAYLQQLLGVHYIAE